MRVLLLSHHYAPEVGAPQRRWDWLVERLVARGHEVAVVTAVPHYPVGRALPGAPRGRSVGRHGETVERVRYVPYDRGRGRRLLDQTVVAVGSVLPGLRARPDVVVATVPGLPTLLPGVLVAGLRRVPLVLEMRDAWPDLVVDAGLGPRRLRTVLVGAVTAAQRRASVVVCVSQRFAQALRGRGVRRVEHVPNGVDLGVLDAETARQPSADPGPPPDGGPGPLRVLYAGTVGESQGLHVALGALAHLPAGTVRVTVVGLGAGLDALRGTVASLPDPTDVVLRPPVPPSEVAGLVGATDTALVCLRDWPAFEATVPSKLYELMARGVHVSAVVAGESAEVVRAAGAGDVVAPGDTAGLARLWGRLAADRPLLDVGGRPRRWVAEHADVDALAARYVRLLEDLVPAGAP